MPRILVNVIPNSNIMSALRTHGTFCRLAKLSETQISQSQSIVMWKTVSYVALGSDQIGILLKPKHLVFRRWVNLFSERS